MPIVKAKCMTVMLEIRCVNTVADGQKRNLMAREDWCNPFSIFVVDKDKKC